MPKKTVKEKGLSAAIEDDIRVIIYNHMKKEGRTISWLSEKINMGYHNLFDILKRRRTLLTQERREQINSVLGTDF
jgi:hypothetical protein